MGKIVQLNDIDKETPIYPVTTTSAVTHGKESLADVVEDRVPRERTIAGIDLRKDISKHDLTQNLELASSEQSGLMSSLQYNKIESIDAMTQEDIDNVID